MQCFKKMIEKITKEVIFNFLEDCAEIGVKGISFVSDGKAQFHQFLLMLVKKVMN